MSDQGLLAGLRVGFGFESGRLGPGRELKLAGVLIDHDNGLQAPGDADIVCRSVLDALLSACGMPDVRTIFPDGDGELSGEESLMLLSQTVAAMLRQRLKLVLNLSVRILAPAGVDLLEERKRMQSTLSAALQVDPGQVTVSFGDAREFAGVEEGVVVAFAHLLCEVRTTAARDRRTKPAPPSRQSEMFDQRPAAGGPPEAGTAADDIADDPDQPERVRKFEKAIQSKLPPLPQAPPPGEGAQLVVYTDGASRGNPGQSSTGWVVLDDQGRLVHEDGTAIGVHTNNQAEYMAVGEAARWIEENLGRELRLEFRLDSELAVKQLTGQWKIKDAALKQLALEVMNQLGYFMEVQLHHVPREQNQRADALANRALGAK